VVNPSTNPAVWRTALLSVVAALVSAGVIGPQLGDQINQWVGVAVIVATAVLPVVGALWAKTRTAPVAKGTGPTGVLVRGMDGVYAAVQDTGVAERLAGPSNVEVGGFTGGGQSGFLPPPTTRATGTVKLGEAGASTAPPD
jgi:hypothetical protein